MNDVSSFFFLPLLLTTVPSNSCNLSFYPDFASRHPGDVRGGRQRCARLPAAGTEWPEAELLTASQPDPDPACHGAAGPLAPHPLHMAQGYGESPTQSHGVDWSHLSRRVLEARCCFPVNLYNHICPLSSILVFQYVQGIGTMILESSNQQHYWLRVIYYS